jgi:hypothetical protein
MKNYELPESKSRITTAEAKVVQMLNKAASRNRDVIDFGAPFLFLFLPARMNTVRTGRSQKEKKNFWEHKPEYYFITASLFLLKINR